MNSTSASPFGWRAAIFWFFAGAAVVFVLVEYTRIASELALLRVERERLISEQTRTQARLDRVEGSLNEWEQRRKQGEMAFDRRGPEGGNTVVVRPQSRNRLTEFVPRIPAPGGLESPLAPPPLPQVPPPPGFPRTPGFVAGGPPGRRGWGHEQAVGPPDTLTAGDQITAWASRQPDGGPEWLRLDFEKPVDIAEVRIRETYNPGAVHRVNAVVNGREQLLWEGTADIVPAPRDFVVPAPAQGGLVSKTIVIHLDTGLVPGWNEIDAVELVGKDGSRQWAVSSSASSTYAELNQAFTQESLEPIPPIPSPARP